MADYTRLAAIEFSAAGKQFIRLYYQDPKDAIRESCYDSDQGWYTPQNNIVAENAHPGTAIAATCWNEGKQIRLFYINSNRYVAQRFRTTKVSGETGTWQDSSDFPAQPALKETQMTAARIDQENASIVLYYQAADKTLHELKYEDDAQPSWSDSDTFIDNVAPGSALAVVASSDDKVRLFYQDNDSKLKEKYSDPDTEWTTGKAQNFGLKLSAGTPIAAIGWSAPKTLQIRLYLATEDGELVELVYQRNKGGWDKVPKRKQELIIKSAAGKYSSITALKTSESAGDATQIFYQPTRVIGAFNITTNQRLLTGIPTVAGIMPGKISETDKPPKYTPTPAGDSTVPKAENDPKSNQSVPKDKEKPDTASTKTSYGTGDSGSAANITDLEAELLRLSGFDVNRVDQTSQDALFMAAERGCVRLTELLIAKKVRLSPTNANNATPLVVASQKGHIEVVRRLLDAKAYIGATVPVSLKNGSTANGKLLHFAVATKNLPLVQLLLQHSADIEARTEHTEKYTPLLMCLNDATPDLIILELLLKAKADVYAMGGATKGNALHWAIWTVTSNLEAVLRLLLEWGSEAKYVRGWNNQTPLDTARYYGKSSAVQALLQ